MLVTQINPGHDVDQAAVCPVQLIIEVSFLADSTGKDTR